MPDERELRLVLTVKDFDEALLFYRDALGFEVEAEWPSDNGRVVLLSAGRATIELVDEGQAAEIDRIEVGRRVAGPVRLAIEVEDSAALAEALEAAGAARLGGPVTTPWNDRNVRLEAPDGTQLTLFTPTE
ncbi:MAG TPA: VOC family protein [Gaiellaceae bacterium]|nr:VOC family protein [Gaiellaceae bacterium]